MTSETSIGTAKGPTPTLRSRVAPPVAALPMPMGFASAGSALSTGETTASYEKVCSEVGAGIVPDVEGGVGGTYVQGWVVAGATPPEHPAGMPTELVTGAVPLGWQAPSVYVYDVHAVTGGT